MDRVYLDHARVLRDLGPVSFQHFCTRVTPVTNCGMSSLLPEDILQASNRIKPYIRRTPLEYSPWLSDEGKSKVFVKLGE